MDLPEIDWREVFEESHRARGASNKALTALAASLAEPLSPAEVEEINRGQRNPFRRSDPLYKFYKPFDAAKWDLPNRPLPAAYLSFLRWSNGGDFRNGERWFQFFPALGDEDGVRAMLLAYHLPEYMPGALPFAFNGGGTFYLFDMRRRARRGEYPVVCAHAGNLGWEADQCARVVGSFLRACRGRRNVDDMK